VFVKELTLPLSIYNRSVPANELVSTFTILTPKTPGKKRITAKFKSYELNDVDGMVNIHVADDFDDNNNIESNFSERGDNSMDDIDINMNRISRMH